MKYYQELATCKSSQPVLHSHWSTATSAFEWLTRDTRQIPSVLGTLGRDVARIPEHHHCPLGAYSIGPGVMWYYLCLYHHVRRIERLSSTVLISSSQKTLRSGSCWVLVGMVSGRIYRVLWPRNMLGLICGFLGQGSKSGNGYDTLHQSDSEETEAESGIADLRLP